LEEGTPRGKGPGETPHQIGGAKPFPSLGKRSDIGSSPRGPELHNPPLWAWPKRFPPKKVTPGPNPKDLELRGKWTKRELRKRVIKRDPNNCRCLVYHPGNTFKPF